MGGVLWAVQLAIYPLFDGVGRDEFVAYHQRYTRGIGFVVGPLMLVEVLSAAWLLLHGLRAAPFVASLGVLAALWACTAFVQVPLHNRLGRSYDAEAQRRLVATNWFRTLGWTARVALLLALAA